MNDSSGLFDDLLADTMIPTDQRPLGGACADVILSRRSQKGGFKFDSMQRYGIENIGRQAGWKDALSLARLHTQDAIEDELERGRLFQYIVSHRDSEGRLRTGAADRPREWFVGLLEDYGYELDHVEDDNGYEVKEIFKKVRP